MFRGSFVAMITPFRDGTVDQRAFRDLVEWHLEQGTHGFVPVGTTGESPTLSHEEHALVVRLCVETVGRRAPVIAGAGSNSTAEAIELTRHAQEVGADAALIVTPYYNKPTQEGLIAHYTAIHDATALPIIIYNIPGRSVVDMQPETMARLAALPRIVGVKDSSADITRPLVTRELCGEEFVQFSGEDGNALAFRAHGGIGCISVTANVAPGPCARMHDLWDAGRPSDALEMHRRLMPLHRELFFETSPSPVKYAVSRLGRCEAEVRLPLVPLSEAGRLRVNAAMQAAGIMH